MFTYTACFLGGACFTEWHANQVFGKTLTETGDRKENHNLKGISTCWVDCLLSEEYPESAELYLTVPWRNHLIEQLAKQSRCGYTPNPRSKYSVWSSSFAIFRHWAFTQNIQLRCPHGARLLQRHGQQSEGLSSHSNSHAVFPDLRAADGGTACPLTAQAPGAAQTKTKETNKQNKNICVGIVSMFLQRRLLDYRKCKVKMNESFKQWYMSCAVLFKLICLPKNFYLVINPQQKCSFCWHFKLHTTKNFGNQDFW